MLGATELSDRIPRWFAVLMASTSKASTGTRRTDCYSTTDFPRTPGISTQQGGSPQPTCFGGYANHSPTSMASPAILGQETFISWPAKWVASGNNLLPTTNYGPWGMYFCTVAASWSALKSSVRTAPNCCAISRRSNEMALWRWIHSKRYGNSPMAQSIR